MSEKIQVTGETIEEAIQEGLRQLNADRADVAINVVDEGSRGVLGIGKRDAVVEVSLLGDADDDNNQEDAEDAAPTVPAEAKIAPQVIVDASDDDDLLIEPELEREAEIALDIVTTMIDMMGMDVDVKAEISEKDDLNIRVVTVNVDGPDAPMLIGEDGQTLNALQFIARSMASQQIQDRTGFVIDVAGFRERRTAELVEVANETARKVIEFNRPISLDPMPPHERRIIHMTLREHPDVKTESKGDGDRRRVRVMPEGWVDRHLREDRRGGGYRGSSGGYRGRQGNNRGYGRSRRYND